MAIEEIKYQDNVWDKGTQVPDKLITINHTDAYKLLEALNIDWKNINIPYAKNIIKWNAAGIAPNTPSDHQAIKNASLNEANNTIDWYGKTIDWLDERGYYDDTNGYTIPDWSKNGNIEKSKDIVEILDYLLWRVIVLDFYTNNWDSRGSGDPVAMIVLGKWAEDFTLPNEERNYPTGWDPMLYYRVVQLNVGPGYADDDFLKITLKPNIDRLPQKLLINEESSLYSSYNSLSANDKNDVILMLCSTSDGNIIIPPANSFGTIFNKLLVGKTLNGIDDLEKTISQKGKSSIYVYPIYIEINSTESQENFLLPGTCSINNGVITGEEGFVKSYIANIDSADKYNGFDASSKNILVPFHQLGDTVLGNVDTNNNDEENTDEENDNTSTAIIKVKEIEDNIKIKITKTRNTLINVTFNENTIEFDKISAGSNIGNTYVSKGINYDVAIPYKINDISGTNKKYAITINSAYGVEHGLYPFFIIKVNTGGNTYEIADDYKLLKDNNDNWYCTSSYGNIKYDSTNNYYYYEPCEDKQNDKTILIEFILYYKDNDPSRPIAPLFGSFKIKLKAEIVNKIVFNPKGLGGQYIVYDENGDQKPRLDKGSALVIENNVNGELVTNHWTTGHGISYCVATVKYNEFDEANTGEGVSFSFTDFVHTICYSDSNDQAQGEHYTDYKVELIGEVKSSADYIPSDSNKVADYPADRSIYIYDENDNSHDPDIYGLINNSIGTYNIYKETNIKVGTEINGNTINNYSDFLYSNDSPENYNLPEYIIQKLNELEVSDIINNDELHSLVTNDPIIESTIYDSNQSNQYIETVINNSYPANKKAYKIKKSTAQYPNENGIITDNSVLVDADNDYTFLVFRITAPPKTLDVVSYSGAVGYLFLRILRDDSALSLTFGDYIEGKEIKYELTEGTELTPKEYSMRVIPRSPIYLDRLFDANSYTEFIKHTGKKYWCFYNVDGSIHSAAVWDDTQVAIKDKRETIIVEGVEQNNPNYNEEFMKIWNEGEYYPVSNYVETNNIYNDIKAEPSTNNSGNISTTKLIPDFSSNTTARVGSIGEITNNLGSRSGSILFINKLLKANYTYPGQSSYDYMAIENKYVGISLGLSIGNDNKYKRYKQLNTFVLNVYKRKYDFELLESNYGGSGNYIYREISKHTNMNTPYIITNKWTGNITLDSETPESPGDPYNPSKVARIFLGSNSLGNPNNAWDNEDQVKIEALNDSYTQQVINLNGDAEHPNYVRISITGDRINDNWLTNGSLITPVSGQYINIYYSTALENYNTGGNATNMYKRAFYLFGLNSSGQLKSILFTIAGDDDGIYDKKTLTLYYVVDLPSA